MGSVKNAAIAENDERYARNRHYHEVQKLKKAISMYSDRPDFVAKLKRELAELQDQWKRRNG